LYLRLVQGLQGADRDRKRDDAAAFWRDYLRDLTRIALPVDGERAPIDEEQTLGRLRQPLAAGIREPVMSLCKATSSTPFVVFLSALALELAAETGERDILVPTLWNGRERRELRDVGGAMVNPLVLRMRIDPSTSVAENLRAIRAAVFETYRFAWTPIDV